MQPGGVATRCVHPRLAAVIHDIGMSQRRSRGSLAHALGVNAEEAACDALARDGWVVLARRVRTEAGELDVLADKDGLLAIVEVKARPTLADAAAALSP